MTKRLAEVAKKAGVSEATVSRVLNGRNGVSEATRASVLTALDVLGYERPTKLRGERGRLVGLVLPELQNPIFPALAEVVTASLAQRGFTPALCARTIGGVPERDYIEMLLDHQVSGVVFAGGSYALAEAEHEPLPPAHRPRMPVVMVNAGVDDLGFPHISTDDAVAVEQAYGHLKSLGHERIGMVIGPEDHMPSRRKLAACQDRRAGGRGLVRGAHELLDGGRAAGRGPADRARRDRHHLRQRRAGARLDPGRPPAGPGRAGRRVGGRLRRLASS